MLKSLKSALVASLRAVFALMGRRFTRRTINIIRAALVGLEGAPGIQREEILGIETGKGLLRFYCLGDLAVWRAETLLTKEPETIAWIDAMDNDDVLWDIGANVGLYSIYAGAKNGLRVLAFEPASANYFLLNRNIEINQLSDRVTAYCLALNNRTEVGELMMQGTELGGALNSFNDPVDHYGNRFVAAFRQGMLGYAIDDFVTTFNPPFPNHIKVDVDGIEDKIIKGAARTLSDRRLKSLSIELDDARPDYSQSVIADIEAGGLKFVRKSHSEMFDNTEYRNIYNYHFHRPAPLGGKK